MNEEASEDHNSHDKVSLESKKTSSDEGTSVEDNEKFSFEVKV